MNSFGKIELIIGPMFASKSTELIKIANRYSSIGKKIILVNHKINKRYGTNNIVTHDEKILTGCILIEKLTDIWSNYKQLFVDADIIIVEELQFFPDAYEFFTISADKHQKTLIGVGLDGDYNREPFGDITRLIPHAEVVTKLNAFCKICSDGTLGSFTKKIFNGNIDDNEIIVGGDELFIPVCRHHYLNNK
jgi:thymidine kinase